MVTKPDITQHQDDWYAPLRQYRSLGVAAARPGSLAGLHQARKAHLGQFFTVNAVARLVWATCQPAIRAAGRRVSILDTSVGVGRLLQFADPENHAIYGVDVHQDSIRALAQAADAAGFECEFHACGMEGVDPSGFDVALINPPFSIHLESPLLDGLACTTWGKFGPHSSAMSHAYALHQAVFAASIVVAVLPTTYASQLPEDKFLAHYLRAIVHLPKGAFREERTEVSTSIAVLSSGPEAPVEVFHLESLGAELPDFGLTLPVRNRARMKLKELDVSEPTITLPVVRDNTVKVGHDGRKITLGFGCGLTQARVLNNIYRERIKAYHGDGHRRPREVRYTGQGVLDVEAHLAQPDPQASLRDLLMQIKQAGGQPEVDAGFLGYFWRRVRAHKRSVTPFRHTIFVPHGATNNRDVVTGRARKAHVVDPSVWGSPAIRAGQEVEFRRLSDGTYTYEIQGKPHVLNADEVYQRFEVDDHGWAEEDAEGGAWQIVHKGLREAFPDIAKGLYAKAASEGLDEWMWPYQLDDAVELTMKPRGAVTAWEQALGKARLAAALIILSGCKRGLIVVEAYLVPEMIRELEGLPISADDWQVIQSADDLSTLRRINVISYERLRRPVDRRTPRRTYGRVLRRRVGTLVADEGHLLANAESQQSRALWALSAKRRYILTGSPIANYPRDALPLLAFTGGDGTAAQPYGYRRAYMAPALRNSCAYAERGIDRFREDFVTTVWVTNQFADTLHDGAKREVPRIASLDKYRAALAPHILRRVTNEPEVAKYARIAVPKEVFTEVEWDDAHLSYYLKVADEFTESYRRMHQDRKGINLVALLARIGAVEFAANYPQHGVKGFGSYMPLTSKQRAAVARLKEWTEAGHQSVMFCENPGLVNLIARELEKHDISCVRYHGKIPIKQRTAALNDEFRTGKARVLLCTFGVAQCGLNLPEADRMLFLCRNWAWTTEYQAMRRILRPQQLSDNVVIEYLHLPGSIDDYQGQMVAHKRDSMHAGLDWAAPELDDVEFLHLDTMLGQFVRDFSEMLGMEIKDLKQALRERSRTLAAPGADSQAA